MAQTLQQTDTRTCVCSSAYLDPSRADDATILVPDGAAVVARVIQGQVG